MASDKHKTLLTINSGSSSVKFSLFLIGRSSSPSSFHPLRLLYQGHIVKIGESGELQIQNAAGQVLHDQLMMAVDHEQALRMVLYWLEYEAPSTELTLVGHRVVHGGLRFHASTLVSEEVLEYLQTLIPLAPNHQPANLQGMKLLRELRPGLPQVACFDTAFHATRPEVEQRFALPAAGPLEKVRRYGFHGLSYEYIARELPDYLGMAANGKVVVAHLGHGASLCAMENRRSVATTMTFTPLDGIPMGTRSGSIDPAVVLYLEQQGMTMQQISELLYFQSGLLGVSGSSDDVEVLLGQTTPESVFAIDLFVHHTVRAIGSLAAALGGIDALIFTGGIGEHAASIRAAICQRCEWLGLELDADANQNDVPCITHAKSLVSAWVIATNEELMIAQHSYAVINKQRENSK